VEVIRADNLWKSFGPTVALRDVSVAIGEGLYLLLGPNGSGKTTFLKLVVGFLKPTRGRLTVLGHAPWRDYVKLRERLAFAFEGMPLPWWESGKGFIEEYCGLRCCDESTILEAARKLGVVEYWERPILGYSSGMRKKLLLLLALGVKADLYVLDEPFTLIDKRSLEELCNLLSQLPGRATLVATHIVPEAIRQLNPSILEFSEGQILREVA